MTEDQKNKCHAIIHTHAVVCAAGNLVPMPGVGVATDVVTMTTMASALAAVFGTDISKEAAKSMAIAAVKNTMLRQPIKTLTKELSKLVPFLGQIVAPTIGVTMIESAGWVIVSDLEKMARAA